LTSRLAPIRFGSLSIAKVSQADTDEIIRQLVNRAKAGEDKAIHAYARLLGEAFGRAGQEAPVDPRPTSERPWEEWSEAERASYGLARLEQREREDAERRATGDASDPRGEG
jgi:hypothetical protein